MLRVKLYNQSELEAVLNSDWKNNFVRSPQLNAMMRWKILNEASEVELVEDNADVNFCNFLIFAEKDNVIDDPKSLIGPVITVNDYFKYAHLFKKHKHAILRRPPIGPFNDQSDFDRDKYAIYHYDLKDQFYQILPIAIDEDVITPYQRPKREKVILMCEHWNEEYNKFKTPVFLDINKVKQVLYAKGWELRLLKPTSFDEFLVQMASASYYFHPSLIEGNSYNQMFSYILGTPVITFKSQYNIYTDPLSSVEIELSKPEGDIMLDLVNDRNPNVKPVEDQLINVADIDSRTYQNMSWHARSYGKKFSKYNWLERFLEICNS